MPERLQEILRQHEGGEANLLRLLHAVQEALGYIPREAIPLIAEALNLSRAEVHGVITFYHDFRAAPAGRRTARVCRGEACQSMGGEGVAAEVLARLGLEWGETSADGALTVDAVYCLGLCAVAPAALIDGEPLGKINAERLEAALVGPS